MGPGEIAGTIAAIAAGVAGAAYLARNLWRFGRRVGHLLDDLLGEPARPGQPVKPGLMERVANLDDRVAGMDLRMARMERRVAVVEAEVKPNDGSSLKDQVTRIEQATGAGPG